MFDFLCDIRHSFRFLAKKPGFAVLAIVSLALGIGANGAIFTLVDSVLLAGPVAEDPEELVEIYLSDSGGFPYAVFSYPDYLDVRESEVFSGVLGQRGSLVAWDNGRSTEMLFGEEVSANYFDVLGIPPFLGRGFRSEEGTTPGEAAVVVLGHGFWARRMGADPRAIGRNIELSGVDFTVIGVAPERLKGDLEIITADFFVPITMHDRLAESASLVERGHRSMLLRGRLAEGVSVEQASSEMERLAANLATEYPATNEGRQISVVPATDVAVNPGFDGKLRGVAGILLALVGMVLLIACSNIANLLLVRASDRRREIAIRLALGSGRGRLARRLLSESFLLALAGGGLGWLLARGFVFLAVTLEPPTAMPLNLDLQTGGRVTLFVFGLSLLTGLVCGLAPALQSTRPDLVPALKEDTTGGSLFRRFGLRNILVVTQVAVSTVLLIGAGLFVRSLWQAQAIDPGFTFDHGVAVQLALGLGGAYSEEEGSLFQARLKEEVEALPGVDGAAYVGYLPLGLQRQSRSFQPEGMEFTDEERWPDSMTTVAGPSYFEVMGIEVIQGRGFAETDVATGLPVVVINQTLARRYFPSGSPLGKRIRWDEDDPWMEVVGVAADGKYGTLGEEARPFVYRPLAQEYDSSATLLVSTRGDEAVLFTQVRQTLDKLDPNLALLEHKLMSEHRSVMLLPATLGATLLSAFSLIGLLLASVGLYGVVAYTVSQRTRELGIRVAIGASRGDVLGLVARTGSGLVLTGLVIGLALAALGARVLSSLLYGVGHHDLITFVAVPCVLLAVAALAHVGPVFRALGVSPAEALRYE